MGTPTVLERSPAKVHETKPFQPDLVYFEPDALNYPEGKQIMEWVKAMDIPLRMTTSHNHITNLPGETGQEHSIQSAWSISPAR